VVSGPSSGWMPAGAGRGAPRNGIDRGNHVANGASRAAIAASLRALDGARAAAPAGGSAARHVRLAAGGRGLWRADGAARPADRGAREHVLARTEGSEAAEGETLETVLAHLPEGFHTRGPRITRPDGGAGGPRRRHAARCGRAAGAGGPLPPRKARRRGRTPSLRRRSCAFRPAGRFRKDRPPAGRDPRAGAGLRSRHGRPRAAHVRRDPPGAARSGGRTRCFMPAPTCTSPGSEAAPRAEGHLDTPYLRSERQCLLRLPRPGRSCSRSTPTCCPSLP
jgi:hypothetical protein